MLPFLRKRTENDPKTWLMTNDRRNVCFLQEIGFAEFNSDDVISVAMLFSSVQPIAAYTLSQGRRQKMKVKESHTQGAA